MNVQRKLTNIELAKHCKEVIGCYRCPEFVKQECLLNECWKGEAAYDCVCPAVFYGVIPKCYETPRIDYEKIATHLQRCGWRFVTDVSIEREINHQMKRKPPFKTITIYGEDFHGNQVAYTLDLTDIENWMNAERGEN